VQSPQGDIASFNQFCGKVAGSDSILTSRDHNQWLTFLGTNLKTRNLSRHVQELDSQPDVGATTTLELKDGRVFELLKPQRLGDHRQYGAFGISPNASTESALWQRAKFRTWAETTDAIIFIIQGSLSSRVAINLQPRHYWLQNRGTASDFLPTAQAQKSVGRYVSRVDHLPPIISGNQDTD